MRDISSWQAKQAAESSLSDNQFKKQKRKKKLNHTKRKRKSKANGHQGKKAMKTKEMLL